MKKIFAVTVLSVFLAPALAFAQQGDGVDTVYPKTSTVTTASSGVCSTLTSNGLNGVVKCLLGLMNNAVVLILAAAVFYTIWGAFQMIRSEEKRESGRQTIVYGVIGIFVMISVWGLVNILNNTFKLDSGPVTPPSLVNSALIK